LPGFISMGLITTELDFGVTPYSPAHVENSAQLLELYEKSVEGGRQSLASATESDLLPEWTLRHGDQIFMVLTKYELVRHSLGQTIHHRAQLGVFLRLLDIPIPGSYGPSADEPGF